MIGGGRKPLRNVLVAARCNPQLRTKYDDMKKAGKPSKVALVAIMRKLLILANTLVKENRLWERK